jgi:Cu/Ag efflux pump CusA
LRAPDYSGRSRRNSQFADRAISHLAPPQVSVTSVYVGASAQTVETAVTVPIEQQINGAEGMKYVTSEQQQRGELHHGNL